MLARWLRFSLGLILASSLASCKKDESFSFLEEPGSGDTTATDPVDITSTTPTGNPVIISASSVTTFAVTASNAETYEWLLDSVQVATGTSGFYNLIGATFPAGTHTLQVIASNSVPSSDSFTWNLRKNNPPTISSSSPSAAGNSVSCGVGVLSLQVIAADLDAEALSFSWKLNGVSTPAMFTVNTVGNQSDADFAPSCAVTGSNNVSVEISDGSDTTTYTWGVSVTNPSVASIDSFNPSSSLVVIPSASSQAFSISASGKTPLTYSWSLNGTPIGGATSAIYTLDAVPLAAGTYTLTARVDDPDSFDTHDFTVIRNGPPQLSSPNPASTSFGMKYGTLKVFQLNASDPNGDALTYTWTLDGIANGSLIGSGLVGGTQANFTPAIGQVGSHVVAVSASDGYESASYSWTVKVNHFSTVCNNLTAGEVCTVVGKSGIGSGRSPVTESDLITLRPDDIEEAEVEPILDAGDYGLFVTDALNHVVWYYNRDLDNDNLDHTVLGIVVPAKTIKVVAGNGANGKTADGLPATEFKLESPQDSAWDSSDKSLFIADTGNHRVVRVTSAGIARRVACTETTTNNAASNTNGSAATAQVCSSPLSVAVDPVARRLFVTSATHAIKYFNISDPNYMNWVGYVLVGRGAAATSASSEDGVTGDNGNAAAARTASPTTLDLSPNGQFLFFGGASPDCRLRVINFGANQNFFGAGVTAATPGAGGHLGRVTTLSGTYNSCAGNLHSAAAPEYATAQAYSAALYRDVRGLTTLFSGTTVLGWFVATWNNTTDTNDNSQRIAFINNNIGAVTIGNSALANNQVRFVFGASTGPSYNGDLNTGITTELGAPKGLLIDANGYLVVGDTNNLRVRSLNISVTNGAVANIAGGGAKNGFSGDANTSATDVLMNAPSHLVYDSYGGGILYTDTNNQRIRTVNLTTGLVSTLIGSGAGEADFENVLPTALQTRGIRGLATVGNNLLFVDRDANGINNNCMVRAYNRDTVNPVTHFNISINSNKVRTVAGNYANGCANAEVGLGGAATSITGARFDGVGSDGTNLYISNIERGCILKVTSAGVISQFIGQCGSNGDVDGPIGDPTVLLNRPSSIFMDPIVAGNFFVMDQSNAATGKLKYVNNSGAAVSIGGVSTPAGQIRTIRTVGGYGWGVTAYSTQVCYTSGSPNINAGSNPALDGDKGSHNVTCYSRSSGAGLLTLRVGPADNDTRGGGEFGNELDGKPALYYDTTALPPDYNSPTVIFKLFAPTGVAFDGDGNLWFSENGGHVIRMVKRWY